MLWFQTEPIDTVLVRTIDYRGADGRFFLFFFLLSARGVTIPNGHFVSSGETEIRAGIRQ